MFELLWSLMGLCWHKWEVFSAHRGIGISSIVDGSTERYITVVLYGCRCGAHKTKTLNGHWKLEDLRAERPDSEREGQS